MIVFNMGRVFNKIINKFYAVFFGLMVGLLHGCATSIIQEELSQPKSGVPQTWQIDGRISVITSEDNWYSGFNWITDKHDYQLRFTGPLGQTELEIRQSEGKTWLKTSSNERTTENLQQLLLQETGWIVPVGSLRYWILGFADPNKSVQYKNHKKDQLSKIEQSGWTIQYSRHQLINGQSYPKKIVITDGSVKVKIIITRWEF